MDTPRDRAGLHRASAGRRTAKTVTQAGFTHNRRQQ